MIFPDERIAEVVSLGPIAASDLLKKARAGDLQALADWTVRSAYQKIVKAGEPPVSAILHLRTLLKNINLRPAMVP